MFAPRERRCDPNGDRAGAGGRPVSGLLGPGVVSSNGKSSWPGPGFGVRTLNVRGASHTARFSLWHSNNDGKPLPPRFPTQQLTISRAHVGRVRRRSARRSRSSQRAAAGPKGGRESPRPTLSGGEGELARDGSHACMHSSVWKRRGAVAPAVASDSDRRTAIVARVT